MDDDGNGIAAAGAAGTTSRIGRGIREAGGRTTLSSVKPLKINIFFHFHC